MVTAPRARRQGAPCLGPEHTAPTSEQRSGDADRDPPRRAADERRPARADEPGGRRPDVEEEPPDAEGRDPGRVDADREPERAAAETRLSQEPAEQREPEELRQRRAARERREERNRLCHPRPRVHGAGEAPGTEHVHGRIHERRRQDRERVPRIATDAGDALAVLATTLVYAAVHVLRARSFAGPVHAWSGVAQTITLFAPLANGAALPQLLGLALLGWLLAVARLRSSALWLPIGIHAAWVATFRVGRLFFDLRPTPPWLVGTGWPPLVGGVAGWIAVGVAAALLARRRGMFRS